MLQNSTIFTSIALTKLATSLPRIKALAIFLLTLGLLTFTSFLNLIKLNSQIKRRLYLLINLMKRLGIPRQGIKHSLPMLAIRLLITTASAITILITKDLQIKAFTIHF
jgi:hypothetical protein